MKTIRIVIKNVTIIIISIHLIDILVLKMISARMNIKN